MELTVSKANTKLAASFATIGFVHLKYKASPTQAHPAKIACFLVYSLWLFGKRLFSMQDKLVKKQIYRNKTSLRQ